MPARLEMPNPPTLEGVVRLLIGYLKSGQAVRSHDPDACVCLYRGPNGAQCFVGLFIPDELYKDEYNSMGVHELFSAAPKIKALLCSNAVDSYAWSRLQARHDSSSAKDFARNALANLREFSYNSGLKISSSEFQLD